MVRATTAYSGPPWLHAIDILVVVGLRSNQAEQSAVTNTTIEGTETASSMTKTKTTMG